ncbi:MAG: molybdenum cofactor biosynthesis protein MoaE [Terriglobia bacterium]
MKVRVLFFGLAHEVTGFAQETVEVQEGATLAALWQEYERRFPRLSKLGRSLTMSINEAVAEPNRTLHEADEVAFLPPVSGGAEEEMVRITREPIDAARLARELKGPADGAVVVFGGTVRNHSNGRKTLYLEYEAYEPMALHVLEVIRDEAKRKFPVDRVGIVHRIGRLEIGETSVAVVVTSAHRAAAFDACRYAIDELKRRAPIWKKEYFEDGSAWAESETEPRSLATMSQGTQERL